MDEQVTPIGLGVASSAKARLRPKLPFATLALATKETYVSGKGSETFRCHVMGSELRARVFVELWRPRRLSSGEREG